MAILSSFHPNLSVIKRGIWKNSSIKRISHVNDCKSDYWTWRFQRIHKNSLINHPNEIGDRFIEIDPHGKTATRKYSLFPHKENIKKCEKSFGREVEALSKLFHKNIIKMIDHEKNPISHSYRRIQLEYHPLSFDEVIYRPYWRYDHLTLLHWFYQLFSALSYMHHHRFIHRDIKPENLLISYDGCLIVNDFETAKEIDQAQDDQSSLGSNDESMIGDDTGEIGTRSHWPPEMFLSIEQRLGLEPRARSSMDIYSAGVTCLEMVIRRPCYKNESESKEAFKTWGHLYLPSFTCDQPDDLIFIDIINMCTVKDPQMRRSAKDIETYLGNLLKSMSIDFSLRYIIDEYQYYKEVPEEVWPIRGSINYSLKKAEERLNLIKDPSYSPEFDDIELPIDLENQLISQRKFSKTSKSTKDFGKKEIKPSMIKRILRKRQKRYDFVDEVSPIEGLMLTKRRATEETIRLIRLEDRTEPKTKPNLILSLEERIQQIDTCVQTSQTKYTCPQNLPIFSENPRNSLESMEGLFIDGFSLKSSSGDNPRSKPPSLNTEEDHIEYQDPILPIEEEEIPDPGGFHFVCLEDLIPDIDNIIRTNNIEAIILPIVPIIPIIDSEKLLKVPEDVHIHHHHHLPHLERLEEVTDISNGVKITVQRVPDNTNDDDRCSLNGDEIGGRIERVPSITSYSTIDSCYSTDHDGFITEEDSYFTWDIKRRKKHYEEKIDEKRKEAERGFRRKTLKVIDPGEVQV